MITEVYNLIEVKPSTHSCFQYVAEDVLAAFKSEPTIDLIRGVLNSEVRMSDNTFSQLLLGRIACVRVDGKVRHLMLSKSRLNVVEVEYNLLVECDERTDETKVLATSLREFSMKNISKLIPHPLSKHEMESLLCEPHRSVKPCNTYSRYTLTTEKKYVLN